jgi:acyl-[acyl carrier protein]--UDP-N-acetylglucosamine O-acyltransferase
VANQSQALIHNSLVIVYVHTCIHTHTYEIFLNLITLRQTAQKSKRLKVSSNYKTLFRQGETFYFNVQSNEIVFQKSLFTKLGRRKISRIKKSIL